MGKRAEALLQCVHASIRFAHTYVDVPECRVFDGFALAATTTCGLCTLVDGGPERDLTPLLDALCGAYALTDHVFDECDGLSMHVRMKFAQRSAELWKRIAVGSDAFRQATSRLVDVQTRSVHVQSIDDPVDSLRVSCEKGAYTTLACILSIDGDDTDPIRLRRCAMIGAYVQLLDDMVDVDEDIAAGVHTMATHHVRRCGDCDVVARKALCLRDRIIAEGARGDMLDAIAVTTLVRARVSPSLVARSVDVRDVVNATLVFWPAYRAIKKVCIDCLCEKKSHTKIDGSRQLARRS